MGKLWGGFDPGDIHPSEKEGVGQESADMRLEGGCLDLMDTWASDAVPESSSTGRKEAIDVTVRVQTLQGT